MVTFIKGEACSSVCRQACVRRLCSSVAEVWKSQDVPNELKDGAWKDCNTKLGIGLLEGYCQAAYAARKKAAGKKVAEPSEATAVAAPPPSHDGSCSGGAASSGGGKGALQALWHLGVSAHASGD